MIDLVVRKTPPIDLPVQETAEKIILVLQEKFAKEGNLRGLVLATVDKCVQDELIINEQILMTYLFDNWDIFFPGVAKDAANIEAGQQLVGVHLEGTRERIKNKLMHYLQNTNESAEEHAQYPSLISPAELKTISHPPCDGKPHQFEWTERIVIRSTVRIGWGRRERLRLWRCCGTGGLKRIWVCLEGCISCKRVYKFKYCGEEAFCDQCGNHYDMLGLEFWSLGFFVASCEEKSPGGYCGKWFYCRSRASSLVPKENSVRKISV